MSVDNFPVFHRPLTVHCTALTTGKLYKETVKESAARGTSQRGLVPISLTIFQSQFKFDRNFVLISFLIDKTQQNFAHAMTVWLSSNVQKFCSNHFIKNSKRTNWNFHRIWLMMKKLFVEWVSRTHVSGLILAFRPANERRRYFVTTSLIGWAKAYNQPCVCYWWFYLVTKI